MPIDWVSKAMVHISRRPESFGKVFHFSNPHPAMVSEVYQWVQSFGYEIEVVPHTTWRNRALEVDSSNALSSVTPLIREEGAHPEQRYPHFDCTNTLAALEGTGLDCPPVSEELTHTCLRYLVGVGFIDPPNKTAMRAV